MAKSNELLAFYSWFAYHAVSLRNPGNHPLIRAMPWHEDNCRILDGVADRLWQNALPAITQQCNDRDKFFDTVETDAEDRHHYPAIELASCAADAHRYAVRLLDFETALDPDRTDLPRLSKAFEQSVRSGTDTDLYTVPGRFGPFLFGALGVIERADFVFTHFLDLSDRDDSCFGIIDALARANDVSAIPIAGLVVSQSWNAHFQALAQINDSGPRYSRSPGERIIYLRTRRTWLRRDAGDTALQTPSAMDDEYGSTVGDQLGLHASQAKRLGHEALVQIVQECIVRQPKAFFAENVSLECAAGTNASLSKARHGSLDDDSALRQIALMPPSRLFLRAFNDYVGNGNGQRIKPQWLVDMPFALRLAEVLIATYGDVGRISDLDQLTPAKGERLQRVLHYILRLGPSEVLRNELQDPRIAVALANAALASLEYAEPGSWDNTDKEVQERLLKQVLTGLGFLSPPPIDDESYALDKSEFEKLVDLGRARPLKDFINRARRHAEWILKTAIQWSYHASIRAPDDQRTVKGPAWQAWQSISFQPFFEDNEFRQRVVKWLGRDADPSQLSSRMTLQPLQELLAGLDDVLGEAARHAHVEHLTIARAQLVDFCNKYEVAKNGNLGSHDSSPRNPSPAQLERAGRALLQFQEQAYATPDALPRFLVLVERIHRPNEPDKVIFRPLHEHHAMPTATKERTEFYFTQNRQFSGDRVYSMLDLTRNTLSVDPVVLDWTKWLSVFD